MAGIVVAPGGGVAFGEGAECGWIKGHGRACRLEGTYGGKPALPS